MFEESTNDRAHANIFRERGQARSQHADTANDEIDRDTSLRSFIKTLDDLFVSQPIELGNDSRRTTGFCVRGLSFDQAGQFLTQIDRRNQKLVIVLLARVGRQVIEELSCIFTNCCVGSEDAQVSVG